ncbi:MAG: SWIM zinc finger family protein [Candidatus Zhuqueibacterota bacterium]
MKDFAEEDFTISPELLKINERQIAILDQENTDGEGWDYYCNGQVVRATMYKNRIVGTVRELLETFDVEIKVEQDEIITSCSCGTKAGVCKHTVAFLYSWVNDRSDFLNVGSSIKKLYKMEKSELIDIIGRVIQNDPTNVRFFFNNALDEDELDIEGLIE